MKSKILILGFACLSVAAVAQSDAKKKEDPAPTTAVSPRDAMSGQASGKRMHKPMTIQKEYGAREASTGKATGKTMAQDDWQAPSVAPESKPKATRVAAGDLNGDGKADVASPKFKGLVIIPDPASSDANTAFWVFILDKMGESFLTSLRDSNPIQSSSGSPAVQSLGAGEGVVETIVLERDRRAL